MAKKKLNKVAAAAIVTAVILTVGGVGTYYVVLNNIRPGQNRAEGERLLAAGQYEEAFKRLGRAAHRYTTDVTFHAEMYEAVNHRTSFDDDRLRIALRILDTALTVQPNHVPTLTKRLKFVTDSYEKGWGADDFDTIMERAKIVLDAEPNNEVANRAMLLAKTMKLLRDPTTTAAQIDALAGEIRPAVDADPSNPDTIAFYAVAVLQRREALIRDQSVTPGPDTEAAKQAFADLDARAASLLKLADAADASMPAERRARMYRAAGQIDTMLLSARAVTNDNVARVRQRQLSSMLAAAKTMPPEALLYSDVRAAAASALDGANRPAEAEQLLRDAVAARPELWEPRTELAEYLARHDRPADALEVLGADLKPDEKLIGIEGYAFLNDSRAVPIRRCLFRLQAMDAWRGRDAATRPSRDAEIAKAKADYDLAVAYKVNENDPRALQAMAALQEASGDRSAAAETLRKAVDTAGVPTDLLRPMLRHLVDLNYSINQPGRAAEVLERLVQLTGASNELIELLELRIRNGQVDQANAIVAQLDRMMPGHPIVFLARAKLATTTNERRALLAKIPEDVPAMMAAKFSVAMSGGDKELAREVAQRGLAAAPDNLMLAAQYIDLLIGENKKDDAIKVVDAGLAKQPDNAGLRKIRETLVAGDAGDPIRPAIDDPYELALFDASRLREKGDLEGYIAKLKEALPLDKNKDGRAAQNLFLMQLALNRADEAEPLLSVMSQSKIDPATIRAHRGRLAIARNRPDEALAIANQLVNDLPQFAAGWIVKGEAHQLKQQWDQASGAFDSALNAKPNDGEALRGAVDVASRLGQRDKERRFIDAGLRVSANDPWFAERSLRWEETYGDPVKTIEARKSARDAKPDQPTNWLALAQVYTKAFRTKQAANDQAGAEQYRKLAYDTLNEATAKFPAAPGFPLQAADLAAQGGDVPGALKLIDAMEQTPSFRDDPQVSYVRADFYLTHGQAERGRQLLEGVVASGKLGDPAVLRLADVKAKAGDVNGAIATIDAAPQKSEALAQARFNYLLAANRLDDAAKMADDALAGSGGRSVTNLLMSAVAHAAKGDIAGGLKLADEAVNQSSDDPSARLTRAKIALAERPIRSTDVLNDLDVVVRAAPGNSEARMLRIDRLRALNRGAEAMTELENLQRDQPGNLTVVTQLVDAYLGEKPLRTNRIDGVFAAAKQAGLAKDPSLLTLEWRYATQSGDTNRAILASGDAVKNANGNEIELYRHFLDALIRGKKYGDVLAELDRLQQQNGTLYWTYLLRGVALHQMKRDAEAAPQFERALSLATSLRENAPPLTEIAGTYAGEYGADAAASWLRKQLPNNPEADALAVSLYTREGKFPRAIEASLAMMPKIDQLSPQRQVAALADLGTACLSTTPPDVARARDAFERLLKVDPENLLILNNLAYVLTLDGAGGDMNQAREVAKRAYDLTERSGVEDAYVMDTYGWTLIQTDQVSEGLDVLRRAQSVKRLPEIDFHLGVGLTKQKDRAAALQSLQNALALVEQMEKNGTAMDASLKPKIQEALVAAEKLDQQ